MKLHYLPVTIQYQFYTKILPIKPGLVLPLRNDLLCKHGCGAADVRAILHFISCVSADELTSFLPKWGWLHIYVFSVFDGHESCPLNMLCTGAIIVSALPCLFHCRAPIT